MATLTKEHTEQKLQQLKQLSEEMSVLTKELAEAGALKLSEEDLEKVVGGGWQGKSFDQMAPEEIAQLQKHLQKILVKGLRL